MTSCLVLVTVLLANWDNCTSIDDSLCQAGAVAKKEELVDLSHVAEVSEFTKEGAGIESDTYVMVYTEKGRRYYLQSNLEDFQALVKRECK